MLELWTLRSTVHSTHIVRMGSTDQQDMETICSETDHHQECHSEESRGTGDLWTVCHDVLLLRHAATGDTFRGEGKARSGGQVLAHLQDGPVFLAHFPDTELCLCGREEPSGGRELGQFPVDHISVTHEATGRGEAEESKNADSEICHLGTPT